MTPAPVTDALQLRDIHLPAAPSIWPPAPGWWMLAALLIGLLAWSGMVLIRRLRIRRRRRELLAVLHGLADRLERERSPDGLMQISVLLRRLALARFPRQQVASLSGLAWLHFLDESGGQGRFSQGPGRVLASGPYQRMLPSDFDVSAFVALVNEWVIHSDRKATKAGGAA